MRQGDKKEDMFLLCAMIHLIHRDTSGFFEPHPDWRLRADSGQPYGFPLIDCVTDVMKCDYSLIKLPFGSA